LREAGAVAEWTDAFEILHHPEERKLARKDGYYSWRLDKAIAMDPDWIRYYWFRGIHYERIGEHELARRDFEHAFASRSRQFPVECLNAAMTLAAQLAQAGDREVALQTVTEALEFHDEVAKDFEVAVNFRLRPWFERALAHLEDGKLEQVIAYDFAHGRPARG
jgi:tetratricopeptide (TPR) repeat protein